MKRTKLDTSDSCLSLNEFEVPEGWEIKKLSEVTKKVPTIKPESEPERIFGYVDISSINNETNQIVDFKKIRGEDAPSRAKQSIQPNDVLFSNVRTYLRNIAIVPNNLEVEVCSTGFTVLRSEGSIDPKFLFYYTLTDDFINGVTPQQTGSQYPATTDRVVKDAKIPLPPLAEQEHIVVRVEALLMQVNAARDRLSRVPLIMKKFRQAVLAAACEGRLTEGWREENPGSEPVKTLLENINKRRGSKKVDHLKKIQPILDELNEIPDIWAWTQIGFIMESMKNGVYKTPNFYKDDGFPCLRMYNIEDGKIIWKNIKHMDLSDDEISTYLLKQNDILINRVNSRELVGKSALITNEIEPCVYESKNIRLRMFNEEIDSQYVVFWLQVDAQKYFSLNAQQTVGMASINQDQIASMPIPLPPLAEQHEIVRRVNALFERADHIEQQVRGATKCIEALTQAVLGKAFRGELVAPGAVE